MVRIGCRRLTREEVRLHGSARLRGIIHHHFLRLTVGVVFVLDMFISQLAAGLFFPVFGRRAVIAAGICRAVAGAGAAPVDGGGVAETVEDAPEAAAADLGVVDAASATAGGR